MKVIHNSRAQSTVEFMILFVALLFFFLFIASVVNSSIESRNKDKNLILAQSVALSVRDEISFAAESTDGYARSFTVPETVSGFEYSIFLNGSYVYYVIDETTASYKVFNVTGAVQKGVNTIRKQNGTVYLNA